MNREVVAMLFDCDLRTWSTREDLHLLLAKALMAQGARVLLVFSEAPVEEFKQKFRDHGIEVTALNYLDGALAYFTKLGKLIREHNVTTVNVAFFAYFSLVPWMARLHGVRHIVYHERNPGKPLRSSSWRLLLLILRTRLSTWPVSRVIVISEYKRRQLIEVGMPERKCHVVLHGVNCGQYRPDPDARPRLAAEYGVKPGEVIAAALSFLMPHKNIDTILHAIRRLKDEGIAIRFFMIGHGKMQNDLHALGRELGLDEQIVWMGHIRDPIPVLQACDMFLMVSSGEGFGLALIEAMACGAPSIAAISGALPEIIEDGVSGLLVPERDIDALTGAIRRMATNHEVRLRLGAGGLERVRTRFSADVSTSGVAGVYAAMWKADR